MFKWANSTFGQTNESWFFYEVYSKTTFSFPTPKHPQELLNEYQHHFSMSSRVGLHMTSDRRPHVQVCQLERSSAASSCGERLVQLMKST